MDRKWKPHSHPLAPCLWVEYEHSHSGQGWLAIALDWVLLHQLATLRLVTRSWGGTELATIYQQPIWLNWHILVKDLVRERVHI